MRETTNTDGEARQWEHRANVLEKDWEYEKLRADNATATVQRLRLLLRRAQECCEMLTPPASDCYTNGVQADINAELDKRDPIDPFDAKAWREMFDVRDFDDEGVDVPPEVTDPARLLARLRNDRPTYSVECRRCEGHGFLPEQAFMALPDDPEPTYPPCPDCGGTGRIRTGFRDDSKEPAR
ncbi:MAG TPA: hypothetical protein VEA69_16800 [Tepidisphaeraceae bacterium]|nr:hypothetical protein [Tepidisphaeraceae bacterium]